MNEIINIFLLVGDKFMPEECLKQPGFTYNAYSEVVLLMNQIINLQMNFKKQLLKNSKKKRLFVI